MGNLRTDKLVAVAVAVVVDQQPQQQQQQEAKEMGRRVAESRTEGECENLTLKFSHLPAGRRSLGVAAAWKAIAAPP